MIMRILPLLIGMILTNVSLAAVDTLKGTTDIEDCLIYGYADCNAEITGEDCRRYNAGGLGSFVVGVMGVSNHRTLFKVPGWNGVVPDSSKFLIYCRSEDDTVDRKIFLYPITTLFFEGNENAALTGDYPDPDSGATWNHAWLDVGDLDSANWVSPGGDYTTAVACTTTVTGIDQYFSFDNFNRILNYWDTSGNNYGFILVNENAFPAKSARKVFGATEGNSSKYPLVILYKPDSVNIGSTASRRLQAEQFLIVR